VPVAVLPDVKRVVADYLRSHADVSALVGTRVGTRVPSANAGSSWVNTDGTPKFPLLVVQRIGGLPAVERWLDAARIQLDCWANTEADAWKLASTVQAALWDLPGNRPLGVVTGVAPDLGMTDSPDPDTGRPRVLFGVVVFAHPAP
jgi:hypothetical protein